MGADYVCIKELKGTICMNQTLSAFNKWLWTSI